MPTQTLFWFYGYPITSPCQNASRSLTNRVSLAHGNSHFRTPNKSLLARKTFGGDALGAGRLKPARTPQREAGKSVHAFHRMYAEWMERDKR
jgi:hypothetical protein